MGKLGFETCSRPSFIPLLLAALHPCTARHATDALDRTAKAKRGAPATPNGKVEIVLDTDAYNEVDDQFALAFADLSLAVSLVIDGKTPSLMP